MKTVVLMAAMLVALVPISAASAKEVSQKDTGIIYFQSPDGRAYKAPLKRATGSGFKLERQGVDEKAAGGQPLSFGRAADTVKANTPFIKTSCSMDYMTLHVKVDGTKGEPKLAELRGTHGACKKIVKQQGTAEACPGMPHLHVVVWAGSKDTAEVLCGQANGVGAGISPSPTPQKK